MLRSFITLAHLQCHVGNAEIGGILNERCRQFFAYALSAPVLPYGNIGDMPFIHHDPYAGKAYDLARFRFCDKIPGADIAGHFLIKALAAPRLRKGRRFNRMDAVHILHRHAAKVHITHSRPPAVHVHALPAVRADTWAEA